MNLFTNAATCFFWLFNRYCEKHFRGREDKATQETLTEKNRKFELRKMFQLPWMFWAILAFSMFQTSTASVFSSNATELAQKRFNVDAITAGWYSSLAQYAGGSSTDVTRGIADQTRFLPCTLPGSFYRHPRPSGFCL